MTAKVTLPLRQWGASDVRDSMLCCRRACTVQAMLHWPAMSGFSQYHVSLLLQHGAGIRVCCPGEAAFELHLPTGTAALFVSQAPLQGECADAGLDQLPQVPFPRSGAAYCLLLTLNAPAARNSALAAVKPQQACLFNSRHRLSVVPALPAGRCVDRRL